MDCRELISQLIHCGPDVVEELDFYDRPQSPHSLSDSAAYDIGFRERGIVHTLRSELLL